MNNRKQMKVPGNAMGVRLVLAALFGSSLAFVSVPSANADVFQCGGEQPLGFLTCSTTGPAMINGNSFAGDGGSSAQLQWQGATTMPTPGLLQLTYTYTGIYNSLFSKIGMRLSVAQPTCEDAVESRRDWVEPSVSDGVARTVSVTVDCAGPVNYTITSRAATYALGGSFVGQLNLTSLAPAPPRA